MYKIPPGRLPGQKKLDFSMHGAIRRPPPQPVVNSSDEEDNTSSPTPEIKRSRCSDAESDVPVRPSLKKHKARQAVPSQKNTRSLNSAKTITSRKRQVRKRLVRGEDKTSTPARDIKRSGSSDAKSDIPIRQTARKQNSRRYAPNQKNTNPSQPARSIASGSNSNSPIVISDSDASTISWHGPRGTRVADYEVFPDRYDTSNDELSSNESASDGVDRDREYTSDDELSSNESVSDGDALDSQYESVNDEMDDGSTSDEFKAESDDSTGNGEVSNGFVKSEDAQYSGISSLEASVTADSDSNMPDLKAEDTEQLCGIGSDTPKTLADSLSTIYQAILENSAPSVGKRRAYMCSPRLRGEVLKMTSDQVMKEAAATFDNNILHGEFSSIVELSKSLPKIIPASVKVRPKSGLYLLHGWDDEGNTFAYIGQSQNLRRRAYSHRNSIDHFQAAKSPEEMRAASRGYTNISYAQRALGGKGIKHDFKKLGHFSPETNQAIKDILEGICVLHFKTFDTSNGVDKGLRASIARLLEQLGHGDNFSQHLPLNRRLPTKESHSVDPLQDRGFWRSKGPSTDNNEPSPDNNEPSPGDNDSSPGDNESSTGDNDSSPGENDSSPGDNGTHLECARCELQLSPDDKRKMRRNPLDPSELLCSACYISAIGGGTTRTREKREREEAKNIAFRDHPHPEDDICEWPECTNSMLTPSGKPARSRYVHDSLGPLYLCNNCKQQVLKIGVPDIEKRRRIVQTPECCTHCSSYEPASGCIVFYAPLNTHLCRLCRDTAREQGQPLGHLYPPRKKDSNLDLTCGSCGFVDPPKILARRAMRKKFVWSDQIQAFVCNFHPVTQPDGGIRRYRNAAAEFCNYVPTPEDFKFKL